MGSAGSGAGAAPAGSHGGADPQDPTVRPGPPPNRGATTPAPPRRDHVRRRRPPAARGRPPRARTWWREPSIGGVAPFLLGITLLGRASQNTGQTTFPLVAHQIGIANGILGIVAATSGAGGVVTAAVLGARVTARTALATLAAGQAMVLVAFVLLALHTGVPGLWLGAIALGTGGGLVFPATMTAIGSAPRQDRARALAVYALALSIGLAFGPLVESGVLRLVGDSVRSAFGALAVLPLAATAISTAAARRRWLASVPPTVPGAGALQVTPLADAVPLPETASPADAAPLAGAARRAGAAPAGSRRREARRRRDRPGLLRLPAFRLALATMLTYQAPFVALLAFAALLARHADGARAADAELGFGAFFGVSMAVRAAVAAASPLRGRRAVLTASVLATAAGLALLAAGHGYGAYLVAMAVLGAPHGLTFPLASAIVADGVEQADLGRANARLMASTNVVSVLVPLACGWLAAAAGYRVMFLAVEAPVVLFGAALLLELRRAHPPAEPRPLASTKRKDVRP